MGKLFMASLPGTLASSGMAGSYLLPLIDEVREKLVTLMSWALG